MKKIFKSKKAVIAASVLVILVVIGVLIFGQSSHWHFRHKFNLQAIKSYIQSYGSLSIVAFLVISAIRPLGVIIPVTILTIIAGSLYGPIYGFVLAMASILISSNVAFFISRYLGRSFVEKLLKHRAEKINLKIEKSGFKIILIMRLSGVFPLDVVAYAAGLTKVKYRDFILATMLGVMPETFSFSFMGHNINNPLSPGFILSVVLVVLTVGVPLIYNKITAKNKEN
jgi:uncharacterized membrane protein YdjX (TVP38/TMEM64 family)